MLFFVPPEKKEGVREALKEFEEVQFTIDAPGSKIIYSDFSQKMVGRKL